MLIGALDRFDEARSFYSWFYTILRNRCWKLVGSRNRQDTAAEDVEILAASGVNLDQTLALGEALARLQVEPGNPHTPASGRFVL